ncbi:MAG TPA: hypothetical protein VGO25_02820 [Rhodanobacteraceae bacterium]|jgi:hypothetical protein|nr:hypothetical protein [Rhodanobacteraceae bacterium]
MKRSVAATILVCGFVPLAALGGPPTAESGRSQHAELAVGIRINAADDQEATWKAYQASLHRTLAASGTPRNVALAALDASAFPADDRSPTLQDEPLFRAAMGARDDALVQWLIANRLLGSGHDTRVDAIVANATRLEPDNAAVWGLTLALASKRNESAAIDDALAHMAASTRSDEHFADTARAWYEIYERNPFPQWTFANPTDADAAVFVSAMAKAAATALAGYQTLVQTCKPSAEASRNRARAVDCSAIGHLMLYRSTTLLARRIGFVLLRNLGDDAVSSEDHALHRNLEWVLFNEAATDDSLKDPLAMHAYATDWLKLDDEYDILQRALRRQGVSAEAPSDWQPSEHASIAQAASR